VWVNLAHQLPFVTNSWAFVATVGSGLLVGQSAGREPDRAEAWLGNAERQSLAGLDRSHGLEALPCGRLVRGNHSLSALASGAEATFRRKLVTLID